MEGRWIGICKFIGPSYGLSVDQVIYKNCIYSSTYAYLVIIYLLQIISPSLSDVKESILVRGHDKNEDSDSSPDELVKVAEEPKEKWDCESILSEYLCRKIIISLMFCDMKELGFFKSQKV